MRRMLLAIICLPLFTLPGMGQAARAELGFGLGAAVYQGDLSPRRLGNLQNPGASFQVFLNFNLHRAISLRGNFSFASLQADESKYAFAYHQRRNFRFETSLNELSAQVVLNPLMNTGDEEPGNFRPYLFGGAGVSFLAIDRDWSNFDNSWNGWQSWVRPGLAVDTLAIMPKSIMTFQGGAGLRYFFGENLSLYAEGAHRLTKNGYVDGFSHAANPTIDDTYSSLTIGLIFRLSVTNGGRGGKGGYGCPVNVW